MRGKYQHITDQELLDRFYQDRDNEWLGVLWSAIHCCCSVFA